VGRAGGILLVVGNGLTLDLRATEPSLRAWDPTSPLGWPVETPGQPGTLLLENLHPAFGSALSRARAANPAASDFGIIEDMATSPDASEGYVLSGLRHYLAIAYSRLQQEVDKLDLDSWRWVQWLKEYGRSTGAVSFNYDMVLEAAAAAAGLDYFRFVLPEEKEGTQFPIYKVHGSIDYEVSREAVNYPGASYPLEALLLQFDTPLRRLSASERLSPRICPEIVVPTQASHIRDYQWVAPQYEELKREAGRFASCVLAGLSYWDVDRPEIDGILGSLRSDTLVAIVNPSPPPALVSVVKSRFPKMAVFTEDLAGFS
jgi:hypothetical protein